MGKRYGFKQDGDKFVLSINNHEEIMSGLDHPYRGPGI